MPTVHVIYASTSGHTEYVVNQVANVLREADISVTVQLAEAAKPEDLTKADLLILASGTWNTGGVEGQLNPHMHDFLRGRAKDAKLNGQKTAILALGDDRYYYTGRAGEHLRVFIQQHGGTVFGDALLVINEPYGQEERVTKWTKKILALLSA
jgi:flavodoxin